MSGQKEREFLFNYRFGGSEWGLTIHADSVAEAKDKIKAVALARYEGEVVKTIRVPSWLAWWWRR